MSKSVGKAVSHEAARGHVTGSARYADDMGAALAKLAHAWPVMAPHARAQVVAIDDSAALALPGVLLVLSSKDVPGVNDVGAARRDEVLFPDEVAFHGHAVAWVIGDTEEQARLGAGAVKVEYAALPAITSIEAAIEAGSFHTEPGRIVRGDAGEALARASRRLSGELFINGQEHFYLETQAAIARVDEDGNVLCQSSTQHPAETQEIISRVLAIPRNEVVVQCVRMGGAFGGKETQANTWAAVAALAAVRLQRPVRCRLTRAQDTVLTGKRHPFLARFEVGYAEDGKLQGLRIQLYSDGGWALDLSSPVLFRALFHIDNCYLLEDVEAEGRVCKTNHVSQTAFRGFGGPQGMVVIEDILGRIATDLGLPAHQVRLRNFYQDGDTAHYGQLVKDADRIGRIWSELSASADVGARYGAVEAFNEAHPSRKRGLAITPVKFGISFTTAFFNQAGALVLIYKDGSVQVNHGGTEMGQGLHTKIWQIAAQELGVPLAAVRVMATRTDKVPNTSATAASSGSDLNGAAVRNACATLRERLAGVAAGNFKVHPDDVVLEEGKVYPVHDPAAALTFQEVVTQAYLQRVQLFADGYYRTPNIHYDAVAGRGKPFHYFAYGAAVSEVEVDGYTGQYRLLRVDILHDVGDSLSPLVDRGQVEGGFAQGLGWLTQEELVWADDGRYLTVNASTYKLPTLGECPPVFKVSLLEKASEPGVVHGSKAVGEPPFMLAFSVREALRHAVAAFAATRGVVELACPATPEAVFWAIEAVRKRSAGARAAAE